MSERSITRFGTCKLLINASVGGCLGFSVAVEHRHVRSVVFFGLYRLKELIQGRPEGALALRGAVEAGAGVYVSGLIEKIARRIHPAILHGQSETAGLGFAFFADLFALIELASLHHSILPRLDIGESVG